MKSKFKRFLRVLAFIVVLGFVLRQAQHQNIGLALFLGAVLLDFRQLKRKAPQE